MELTTTKDIFDEVFKIRPTPLFVNAHRNQAVPRAPWERCGCDDEHCKRVICRTCGGLKPIHTFDCTEAHP